MKYLEAYSKNWYVTIMGLAGLVISIIKIPQFISEMDANGNTIIDILGISIAMVGFSIGMLLLPIWGIIKKK